MFEIEKKIMVDRVGKMEIEMNSVASEYELDTFEDINKIKLPVDLRDFYLELNGYFDSNNMVQLYALKNVKKIKESNLGIGKYEINEDFFIIGDFGFQATFWLLDIDSVKPGYFALSLGKTKLVKVADSMKNLLSCILQDPYSMIGLDEFE